MNFETHWDILQPAQKRIWPQLHAASKMGFVLYGGTAVALRFGHRQSIDFDFFTDRSLDKLAIGKAFPFLATAQVLQETAQSWTMLAADHKPGERAVQISFFGTITNGRVGVPELTDDGSVLVASPADLLAFKVKVILQRVEAKDYQDIARMLAAGGSLAHALSAARTLFGTAFQPMESLKALTCFNGGDLLTLSPAVRETILAATRKPMRLEPIALASENLALET